MDFLRLALRGEGGYRQYRIPALSVTKSGRLIAIYDGRADFDDLPAPIDLLIRTSDDNGSSWSEQIVFRAHEGISGYGDASIIVDPSYGDLGRIIVLYQFTQHAGFFESALGASLDDPNIAQIARSISDDDGETWRHDFITDQLKDSTTPGIFATSGMGTQISSGEFSGRLLQTFVLRRESQLLSAIGFSDDHGETWKLGAIIPNGNETAIAALADGSILIHSRSTPFRISAFSRDGGLTIDSPAPHPELPDPSDNGSLLRLSSGALICTHNHDQDLRRKTVVKRSLDGGKSWRDGALIEFGSSAYSTACELADGNIGILFERNAYNEIVFCRIALEEFRPTEELPPEELSRDGIEFTVIPRCIIPGRDSSTSARELHERPRVPEVDMSKFRSAERKEVGPVGGSTSGDPLFTAAELNLLLGPISPGLHLGDEVRVSGRLAHYGKLVLAELIIRDTQGEIIAEREELNPGEKVVFLDVRQKVTNTDLERGFLAIIFSYEAQIEKTDTPEEQKSTGVSHSYISVESGLPIESPKQPEES